MRLPGSALITALAFLSLVSGACGDSPATAYHVIKKIPVGGEGGWDYLTIDGEARRLYISRATKVVVLDIDQGTTVGDIPNTPGVHGVALVPELGRGFVSNGGDSTVTVFDTKSLQETTRLKVGTRPDAIIYDAESTRVFTMNAASRGGTGYMTAIESQNPQAVGTGKLEDRPEFAVADKKAQDFDHQ